MCWCLTAVRHPFKAAHVRRSARLVFELSPYPRLLMADFLPAGGEIVHPDFQRPRDFQRLPEQTLIVQASCGGDVDNADTRPDRAVTESAISQRAAMFAPN